MGPAFSIVIPAFREEGRIGGTLDTLLDTLGEDDCEIVVVDDGSDDQTAEVAEKALARFPAGTVLRLGRNRGKGAAVRTGVLASRGDAVVYMDADLASDLTALDSLLAGLDEADVVVGSRTVPGSRTIGSSRRRAIMGRGFNRLARVVTRLPIRDTQCGFKAFRREAAERIFRMSRVDRFAFDVEVLTIAARLGMEIVEVPVVWTAVEGTSVRFVDPFQMSFDLLRIAVRCRSSAVDRVARRADNIELLDRGPESDADAAVSAAAGT